MAEQDEASVKAEKDAILEESAPKKRRWKLHLGLTLLLGVGTWLFWAYSPVAQQFRHNLFAVVQPASTDVRSEQRGMPLDTVAPASEPSSLGVEAVGQTPLFADDSILPEVQVDVEQPVAPAETLKAQANLGQMMVLLQQLQAQTKQNKQLMVNMQNQQVQQMQMQVRVQLFALLADAASTTSSLQQMAMAWKSIALLPMLSEDKRDYTLQAFAALQQLAADKTAWVNALQQALATLQAPMLESGEVVPAVMPNMPTIAPAFEGSWMDWLFAQFHLTKVAPDFSQLSDGDVNPNPNQHATLMPSLSLIEPLQSMLQGLRLEQWHMLIDVDGVLPQLGQFGIDIGLDSAVNLSQDAVQALAAQKQAWQAQAQAWMEQL